MKRKWKKRYEEGNDYPTYSIIPLLIYPIMVDFKLIEEWEYKTIMNLTNMSFDSWLRTHKHFKMLKEIKESN